MRQVGWRLADPIVGLAITLAIRGVIRVAARDIHRRLMDAVDPSLVDQVEYEAGEVAGVERVDGVRVRWVGHELRVVGPRVVALSLRVDLADRRQAAFASTMADPFAWAAASLPAKLFTAGGATSR